MCCGTWENSRILYPPAAVSVDLFKNHTHQFKKLSPYLGDARSSHLPQASHHNPHPNRGMPNRARHSRLPQVQKNIQNTSNWLFLILQFCDCISSPVKSGLMKKQHWPRQQGVRFHHWFWSMHFEIRLVRLELIVRLASPHIRCKCLHHVVQSPAHAALATMGSANNSQLQGTLDKETLHYCGPGWFAAWRLST